MYSSSSVPPQRANAYDPRTVILLSSRSISRRLQPIGKSVETICMMSLPDASLGVRGGKWGVEGDTGQQHECGVAPQISIG